MVESTYGVQKICPHMAAVGTVHGSSLQIRQCHTAALVFGGLMIDGAFGFGVSFPPGTVSSVSEECGAATVGQVV